MRGECERRQVWGWDDDTELSNVTLEFGALALTHTTNLLTSNRTATATFAAEHWSYKQQGYVKTATPAQCKCHQSCAFNLAPVLPKCLSALRFSRRCMRVFFKLTLSHTLALARCHTHTHTHTHIPSLSLSSVCVFLSLSLSLSLWVLNPCRPVPRGRPLAGLPARRKRNPWPVHHTV